MIKKIIFGVILLSSLSVAQVGYVRIHHPVYDFLERMQTSSIISDYNSFELPKTRKEIGRWLKTIEENSNQLNVVDKKILTDFLNEFYLETDTELSSASFITEGKIDYLFGEREKYIYSYANPHNGTSFFANLLGDITLIQRIDKNSSENNRLDAKTTIVNFGGDFRGTFFDKVGFEIFATNGTFFGNRQLANLQGENKFNYKFNHPSQNNKGTDFFDNTFGYLAYENDWFQAKIGRDKNIIGFGIEPDILSDNSTYYDYISFRLKYKGFEYKFMHSRLLGEMSPINDPLSGSMKEVGIKNFVYHRFGFKFKKTFIGVGETVIYNDRSVDLSYLNPFNFYKSAEHANQDRDNAMLFFDLQNFSVPHFKFFTSLIIDDMDFNKFGTSWLGNITILNSGFYSTILNQYLPLEFEFQVLRVDPYAYSHRIKKNNYTNFGSPLGAISQPNSVNYYIKLIYTPHHRFWMDAILKYSVHGENGLADDGGIANNGGDINLGFRSQDMPDAKFLSGNKDITRLISIKLSYEPVNQYFVYLQFNYINQTNTGGRANYAEMKAGTAISF